MSRARSARRARSGLGGGVGAPHAGVQAHQVEGVKGEDPGPVKQAVGEGGQVGCQPWPGPRQRVDQRQQADVLAPLAQLPGDLVGERAAAALPGHEVGPRQAGPPDLAHVLGGERLESPAGAGVRRRGRGRAQAEDRAPGWEQPRDAPGTARRRRPRRARTGAPERDPSRRGSSPGGDRRRAGRGGRIRSPAASRLRFRFPPEVGSHSLTPPPRTDQPAEDAHERGLGARLRWAAGAVRLTLRDPGDGLDRVLERARRLVGRDGASRSSYEPDPAWEQHLHEHLGAAWPCEAAAEFNSLWSQVTESLRHQGLALGRAAYGGWDDGDAGLARAVWCLTRHLPAATVVETGVARGMTSRVILEALRAKRGGTLSSIDLPALDNAIHSEIGAAVPDELRGRWTYLNGTSRSRLPELLDRLGAIDLFVHDSSHTTRNVRFELDQAWRALARGAAVADDIERNAGFERVHATRIRRSRA